METTKLLLLSGIVTIAVTTSLTVTQLFLRKLKAISVSDNSINLSFTIIVVGWFISFTLLNCMSISILSEYINSVFKLNSTTPFADIAKTTVLFIGLTNAWLVLWYFIAQAISTLIAKKRNDMIEMENNHYTYFVIKGLVFISLIYCLMPVFEMLLRNFLPQTEIPYYR